MIEVRLLGPVEVDVDGSALAVDTRKAIALLAYVAVLRRPISRESLTALLWPDSSDHDARGALRRTLSVLRSGLRDEGLTVTRTAVKLEADSVVVDLDRFRSLVDTARRHDHDDSVACAECRATLEQAADLARGPFMEGFALRDSDLFDEWQSAEREVYDRELAGALERLVAEQSAAAAWDRAIATGTRWLTLDPLHEPAHRALMEAYARAGERTAALRQYRDAVATLDRELGVAPLPETTTLYESIQAGTIGSRVSSTVVESTPGAPADARPVLPLVGRQAELARLGNALATAATGGRLVVLEGEAGIGKTRLADRFAELATSDGHRVIEARCYAGEASIAYAPIVALLRSRLAATDGGPSAADLAPATRIALSALLPEVRWEPDERVTRRGPSRPAARLAMLEGIVDGLIGGAFTPHANIIRLDDVQWADDSTFEALAFLTRRLAGHGALVLLSWRREEIPDDAAPLVAAARPPNGEVVRLGRLDAIETRELVTAVAARAAAELPRDAAEDLASESEGLPLYVVEALAAGDHEPGMAPAGIRALLQARLADLSEVAKQVVAAASVIGRSFDTDVVRSVSGRSDEETVEAIEELVRRGIVKEARAANGGYYDFAHSRLREVAYEETSSARRRLLHGRAAAAYRDHPVADPDRLGRLVRIARHEQDAGHQPEAAAAFHQAGSQAREVYANHEAIDYLEAALALGHGEASVLHEEIADVLITLGEYPRATAALVAATVGASPGRVVGIEHRLGRIALRRGDAATAEVHLAAAWTALADTDDDTGPARARILADRADAATRTGALDRAATLAEEAREMARGDRVAEVETARTTGLVARARGDLAAARRSLEQSRSMAEELGDPVLSIGALNALALLAREEGRGSEAIALAETALDTAKRTGERHLEAALESNLADALKAAGRRDEAMQHLKASAELYADLGRTADRLEPGMWMLETW